MQGQLQTSTAQQAKEACERLMFTPGPWRVRFEDIEEGGKNSIDILATQFEEEDFGKAWVADTHQQFTSRENGIANAKLIAAAPEMYDLLKRVNDWITKPDQGGETAWALQVKVEKLLNRIESK